jgi:hypothetical protein
MAVAGLLKLMCGCIYNGSIIEMVRYNYPFMLAQQENNKEALKKLAERQ